jgi:hypothetical protein
MNKCSISIQIFANFTKQLLAQDAKYKNFAEVATFIIKRPGQPDSVKMVALKGLAKIYDQLAKKDQTFSFSADDSKIIDVDLEKDDLETQFKNIAANYQVRPSAPLSIDTIKNDIKNLSSLPVLQLQDAVTKIVKDIAALAKTNFRKSADDMVKIIGELYDRAITELDKNTAVSPIIRNSLTQLLNTEKNIATEAASDYIPLKNTIYGDTKIIVKKDGGIFEVLRDTTGKYIDINSSDSSEVIFDRSVGDQLFNLRVDSSPFVGGNDGTQYIFSHNELRNGMTLRDRTGKVITNQLLSFDNPLSALEVVASRTEIQRNQDRISRIRSEIPTRTLETQEVVSQQKALLAGNPVLSVFSPLEGAQIQFRIPGQQGAMILYGIDNYAIIYPDNRTVAVDFSETQKQLILKLARKNTTNENGINVTEPITEEDFYNLKASYEKFKDFKKAVQEILDQNKNQSEIILPQALVTAYINLARTGEAIAVAPSADQQASLTTLLNKEGGPGQISFNVVEALDDNSYSEPRRVTKPIIVAKQGGVWTFISDLKGNEMVAVDRDDRKEYMSFSDYMQNELKISPDINIQKFPSSFAWLYQKPNGKLQPIALKYIPVENSADIARLAMGFGQLLKKMSDPQTEGPKELRNFNLNVFGFSPYNPTGATSFAGDFDVFKDPSGERSVSIQIRPMTMNWSQVPRDVRKALTVYIDVPVMTAFLKVVRIAAEIPAFKSQKNDLNTAAGKNALVKFIDEDPQLRKQLMSAYEDINTHLYRKFQSIGEKLTKTSYNGEFDIPKIYTLMENEKSDLSGRWKLKIKDRQTGNDVTNFNNYRSMTTEEVFTFGGIQAVFAGPNVSAIQTVNKPAPVTQNPANNTTADNVPGTAGTIEIDLNFEDGAFELAMDTELFQAYQAGQFQQELDWIKANLPKEISVEDLADIMDNLKAEGRVLGYFRDRVIYLNEQLSGRGSGYHEAFHGVFRKLMDASTRDRYLKLTKEKIGAVSKEQIQEFRQRRSLYHLSNAQVIDRIAEEYLADKFKAYKLEGRGAQEGWLNKLMNLIDSIIRFFNKNYKEIDNLFQRIDTGFYKNAKIVGEFKEGAFEMLSTRSTLVTGPTGKAIQRKNFLNKIDQAQLINRLAELTSFSVGKNFEEKFAGARKELIAEMNIDNLIAQNPSEELAIRTRYESILQDKLYTLGVPVSMINETGNVTMDQNLNLIQKDPVQLAAYNKQQADTLKSLKQQVSQKINNISISNIYFDPDAMLNEEEFDEDDLGDETNYEDSFVNINTLDGLSRQFRSFFGLISYIHTDDLGVQTTRMVDGATVFDTMMKILADTPVEKMMSRMEETLEKMLESDNMVAYDRLNAVWDKMKKYFGLNENNQPTRNTNLYNQFIDVFNVADLSTDVYYVNTRNDSSSLRVIDATIQNDINQYYEKLRRKYENGFMKKSTKDREDILRVSKAILKTEVTVPTDLGSQSYNSIKAKAKKVHKALNDIGIILPLHTVIYSLIAIDVKENKVELKPKSKSLKQYILDQELINTGAYLDKDFFDKIVRYVDENTNIFDKSVDKDVATEGTLGLTDLEKNQLRLKKRGLGLINSVLKKTGRYVVKYDLDTVVSVFRNAEGKNVYRYVRKSPPLLIAQSLREKGWQDTYSDFSTVAKFLQDNPLTANKPENLLYLQNIELRSFGGARQTLKGVERDGVTAKTIDTAGYYLSYVLMSMNRKTTINNNAAITTFSRMLTQNEASNTIYMIPNLYKRMVTNNGYIVENKENIVVKGFVDVIKQEYQRIQREWTTRKDQNKEKFNNYNAVLNPDGSVNTEDPSLRAYNFNMLADFFEFNNLASKTSNPLRADIRNQLIQSAKDGIKFDKLDIGLLQRELLNYAEEKFTAHLNILKSYKLVEENEQTSELMSRLIPDSYTVDGTTVSIESEDSNLESYLKDVYFNVFINNLQVSQFFDGDIAMGVKNFADYFKRQKMNVAAGPSMKSGNHTVAYVDEITVLINDNNLEEGQYDENDEMPEGFINRSQKVKSFDGQSVTTIEHRIEQYRKQGRLVDNAEEQKSVEEILKASRYSKLTEEEVDFLRSNKVVLGPKKTVTGALVYYHKQAEHVLFRTDSSYMVVPDGMTRAQVEKRLAELYNQTDILRSKLRNADTYDITAEGGVQFIEDQLRDVYSQIHRYWEPLPNRAAHHYMLNSMEFNDIDQLMDLTSSKKATLLPTKVNSGAITDLSKSKLLVPNIYKFDQVETSKVSTDISSTTQLQHLIDTDINLDDKEVDSNLKDAILQYRKLTGRLSQVGLDRLNNIIKDENGNVEVREIIRSMRDGLETQGADSNTLKFFEIRDDQPVHNINLPLLKKMFTYYYFAFYSNNVFSKRQSGRKDYIVTSWGYKLIENRTTGEVIKSDEIAKNPQKYNDTSKYKLRYPGVKYDKVNNRYIVEVMVPRPYFKNQEEIELFERKLSEFLSTRIPTEDKRSMIVAKVVDFIDGAYQNTIVIPQLIHVLSGSDLDIDSLYSHTFATYEDFNGKQKVYGEANTPKEQFVEYLQSMMQDETLASLIKVELDKVYKEKITDVPESLQDLAEDLNLPFYNYTKEQWMAALDELRIQRNNIYEQVQSTKEKRKQTQEIYEKVKAENEQMVQQITDSLKAFLKEQDIKTTPDKFAELLWEQTAIMKSNFREQGDLRVSLEKMNSRIKDSYENIATANKRITNSSNELQRISRLMKVLATLNILARKNMPITAKQYAKEVSKKGSLVPETLQNDLLQVKIDILSNPYTFKKLYIQERSDISRFENIAVAMKKSIKDVINKNNIFSPDGIIGSRDMVKSSGAGIGIAANVNKFAAFASKKGLKLSNPIWNVNGKNYSDFTADSENRPISDIGNALGMQADAKSNPIPAVLNLNEVSLPITLVMIAQKLPLEMAITINSVPLIYKVIQRVMEEKREIRTIADLFNKRSLTSIARDEMSEAIEKLKEDGLQAELFEVDDEQNIIYDMAGNPKFKTDLFLDYDFNYTPTDRSSAEDFGFKLNNKLGIPLSDDSTQVYLLHKYIQTSNLNNDVFALGSILNLYKKLKPSWKSVDRTLKNYAYLTGVLTEKSQFANIEEILKNSPEFKPLIQGLKELSENAEVILIERHPVMKAIDDTIKGGLQAFNLDEQVEQRITDQITKYFIINKFRQQTETELNEELLKPTPNLLVVQSLKTALEMFNADFWKGEPTNADVTSIEQDFQYLKDNHEGNPFVDYLKERTRQGISFIEALSRMKLEKEYAENVNDGFLLLQNSPDTRSKLIARKLFHYTLVKDGLGYGSNTFINYINPQDPQTFEKISKYLNEFQTTLVEFNKKNRVLIQKGKAESYYKKFNDLLNDFFGKKADLNVYMSSIINRIGLYAGNNDIMVKSRMALIKSKKSRFAGIEPALIMEEMKYLLPDTHALTPKDVYTELEENPENIEFWLPTSKETGIGKLVIDTAKTYSNISNIILSQMNVRQGAQFNGDDGKTQTYVFPLFVKNNFGQILRLTEVDGARLSEKVINNLTSKLQGKSYNDSVSGVRATYIVAEQEGTDSILNLGFSEQEARELYKFAQEDNDNQFLDISITAKFDQVLQKLRNVYKVEPKRLNLLARIVKSEVMNSAAITFEKQKNNLFYIDYTVDTKDRGPVQRKLYLRPSVTDPLSITIEMREREIVTGIETLVQLEDNMREFPAVEIEFVKRGKQFRGPRVTKPANPITKEMVAEVVKNYQVPQDRKLKTKLTFTIFADTQWNLLKENLNLDKLVQIFNDVHTISVNQQAPIQESSSAFSSFTIPAGFVLRPNAPDIKAYISQMRKVSDKSETELIEMYKKINLIATSTRDINDVRKDKDSGDCIIL